MALEWVEHKNARVLALSSDDYPGLTIDVLLEVPFDFPAMYERKWSAELEPGVGVPFVGLEDLLAMKQRAGRPQDLLDVHKLRLLRDNLGSEA